MPKNYSIDNSKTSPESITFTQIKVSHPLITPLLQIQIYQQIVLEKKGIRLLKVSTFKIKANSPRDPELFIGCTRKLITLRMREIN